MKAYSRCEDTVRKYAYDRYRAMGKEEKRKYKSRKEYLHRCTTDEVCERDWEWLRTGKTPEITFETPELEAEIKKRRPHEILTAERLVSQGVRADFIVDGERVYDKKKGWQVVGCPDFKSGVEIKTLSCTSSYSTVNDHIKNSSRKKGIEALIIDNSENNNLSDEKLTAYIKRSRSFIDRKIYIINSNEVLRLIR